MSVAVADFWKLLVDSRLFTPEQCQQLNQEFGGVKGSSQQGNARTLAEWLIARSALSRYQSTLLLAGRPGPFYYGEYKVYDKVDRGRLAGLFKAIHVPTGHPVQLHFLSGPVLQNQQLWVSVATRAQAHCGIVNPYLLRCWELVDLVSFKFLVLEDLPGQLLNDVLATAGRFPPPEACRIAWQAAQGLAQLHTAREVHGDFCPLNLWLEPNGVVKLLRDPLTAPAAVNLATPDPTGRLAAKADYLAPELAQPGKAPDARSDVYALGCTLYQLLSGYPPFPGGEVAQKMQRHMNEPIQPLDRIAGVAPQLAQLVSYLMAKNPNVRIQQASIAVGALAPFVDPRFVNSGPPPVPPTTAAFEKWVKQKQATLAAQAMQLALPKDGEVTKVAPVKEPVKISDGTITPPVGAVAIATEEPKEGEPGATKALVERNKGGLDRNAIIGLSIGGVALLAALIYLFSGGLGKTPPDEPEIAQGGSQSPTGAGKTPTQPPGKPAVSPGGASPQPMPPMIDPTLDPTQPTPVAPAPETTPPAPTGPAYDVVADDGQLPWAAPTFGPPIELRWVPLGAQVFLVARPSELLQTGEGPRVLEALGPTFAALRTRWESAAGVKLDEVEQLVISLHDDPGKVPRPYFVVTLRDSVDLPARWGGAPSKEGDAEVFRAAGWTRHVPASGGGKLFVMGADPEVKAVLTESKGAPPPLRKELERLRRLTDSSRHFTLLCAPNYLFSDGQMLFDGPPRKLITQGGPLERFLGVGDGTQAASFSLHFGGTTYLELRVVANSDIPPSDLAEQYRARLKAIPDQVEGYIAELNPPPYWKRLSLRFPSMIRFLYEETRVGAEDGTALINALLPAEAAHNLVAASELSINSTPGAVSVAGPAAGPAKPRTLAEKLAAKTDLSFPAMTIEFALQQLSEQTEVPIKIIGGDLQLDGITKNQTIREFDMRQQPVADILVALTRKANPDPTVKEAHEPGQKLVWVIGKDPDDPAGPDVVLVTTRAACEKKGYKLGPPFVKPAGETKK